MSDTDVRPPALSTYQVIPYLKTGHHLQCTYLNRRGDPVDRDNLNSRGQGCNTDFVCLQSMAGVVPAVEPPDGRPSMAFGCWRLWSRPCTKTPACPT